jgi:hypothetical protein
MSQYTPRRTHRRKSAASFRRRRSSGQKKRKRVRPFLISWSPSWQSSSWPVVFVCMCVGVCVRMEMGEIFDFSGTHTHTQIKYIPVASWQVASWINCPTREEERVLALERALCMCVCMYSYVYVALGFDLRTYSHMHIYTHSHTYNTDETPYNHTASDSANSPNATPVPWWPQAQTHYPLTS